MDTPNFLAELRQFHPDATMRNGHVVAPYRVPMGGLCGRTIQLGWLVPPDWPMSCPGGPNVSPRLGHPGGAVHASVLGPEWEYWSRPFPGWAAGERTVRRYLGHVRALLAQVP